MGILKITRTDLLGIFFTAGQPRAASLHNGHSSTPSRVPSLRARLLGEDGIQHCTQTEEYI